MTTDILTELKTPESLRLDILGLPKGIDNYHIDVNLSPRFRKDTGNLIAELLKLETSLSREPSSHKMLSHPIQDSYLDMMTILIHRVKTDLSAANVIFLQFSITRFVLESVKEALDEYINSRVKVSSELRTHHSGKVLGAQEHIAWLKKNYNTILYAVNKQVFKIFQRMESKELHAIRKQYLDSTIFDFNELIFNPMLLIRDIHSPRFLIEQYQLWGGSKEDNQFGKLNFDLEELFNKVFPNLDILPLQSPAKDTSAQTEIFDELGGLLLTNKYMGPALDSKDLMQEEFCWLDSPDNVQALFNITEFKDRKSSVRKQQGWKAWWQYRGQIKQMEKVLNNTARIITKKGLLEQFVASYKTLELLSTVFSTQVDPKVLCQYLCGQITEEKLHNRIFSGRTFSKDELNTLKQSAKEVDNEAKTQLHDAMVKTISNLSRYRLHLKYLRFTHRIFNRIHILNTDEDILLSKQAGTLFELLCSDEVADDEARIVHHTILKADVRGSTTVTEELENRKLNPASYFSKRFFSPINKILPIFGANKVFIEGDAIILSFLEHQHAPDQWFGVAHSCGLAKNMLSIIHDNNKHSRQMGLPPLELGIGICYSGDAPRFLHDGDKPIMISSAIGDADRMSSCSWKLREQIQTNTFNVEVLQIADGDQEKGEKGQHFIRYNVNGILLENAAFEKLQSEVELSRSSVKINNDLNAVLYHGQYADVDGKKRIVVIRQGVIGLWQDDTIKENTGEDTFYYEVVTDNKIIALIQN